MLLKPARDTVKVGGYFVQASKGGLPSYYDPIAPEVSAEAASPLSDILYAESQKKTTTLDSGLMLMRQLLSMPGGLTYRGTQEVTLSQIKTSGTRLDTNQINRLLNSRDVKGALVTWMHRKGWRVYVVQEVLTASEFSVISSGGQTLDFVVAGAPPAPCDKTASPTEKTGAARPPTDRAGAKNPSIGA